MGVIQAIEQWLQGKKTYLVMIGTLLSAVIGYLNGQLELVGLVQAILAAFGLGAVRSAVAKSGPST